MCSFSIYAENDIQLNKKFRKSRKVGIIVPWNSDSAFSLRMSWLPSWTKRWKEAEEMNSTRSFWKNCEYFRNRTLSRWHYLVMEKNRLLLLLQTYQVVTESLGLPPQMVLGGVSDVYTIHCWHLFIWCESDVCVFLASPATENRADGGRERCTKQWHFAQCFNLWTSPQVLAPLIMSSKQQFKE